MNHTTKLLSLIIVQIVLLSSIGCYGPEIGSFYYRPDSQYVGTRTFPIALAVKPFIDGRPLNYKKLKGWLVFIPLVPYVKGECSRPEEKCDVSYKVNPSRDFAKALVYDLQASRLFRHVTYVEKDQMSDSQLLFQGTVNSTNYIARRTLYGLSYGISIIPIILPLPLEFYTNELELHIRLIAQKNGEVIWEKTYKDRSRQVLCYGPVFLPIYLFGPQYFVGYPNMVEKIDRDIMNSLEKELSAKPPGFWKSLI